MIWVMWWVFLIVGIGLPSGDEFLFCKPWLNLRPCGLCPNCWRTNFIPIDCLLTPKRTLHRKWLTFNKDFVHFHFIPKKPLPVDVAFRPPLRSRTIDHLQTFHKLHILNDVPNLIPHRKNFPSIDWVGHKNFLIISPPFAWWLYTG